MNERGLIDMWRVNNPNTTTFTWKNKSGLQHSRIYFWLISDSLQRSNCEAEIAQAPLTDHKAVMSSVRIALDRMNKRNPAYWKMNNSLLDNVCLFIY